MAHTCQSLGHSLISSTLIESFLSLLDPPQRQLLPCPLCRADLPAPLALTSMSFKPEVGCQAHYLGCKLPPLSLAPLSSIVIQGHQLTITEDKSVWYRLYTFSLHFTHLIGLLNQRMGLESAFLILTDYSHAKSCTHPCPWVFTGVCQQICLPWANLGIHTSDLPS